MTTGADCKADRSPCTGGMDETNDCVICFGDIHGHVAAAKAAIELAERLGVPAVFLGDYVDRGPDSLGVLIEAMSASRKHPEWIFLLGNHDLMLMQLIDGIRHPEGYDERTFNETLPTIPTEMQNSINAWLRDRPVFKRRSACLFVHGGFTDSSIPLDEVSHDELVWTYGVPRDWRGEMVVRGHAVVDEVEIRPHDININTRCGFGGVLTGLLIDCVAGQPRHLWTISENGHLLRNTPIHGQAYRPC